MKQKCEEQQQQLCSRIKLMAPENILKVVQNYSEVLSAFCQRLREEKRKLFLEETVQRNKVF